MDIVAVPARIPDYDTFTDITTLTVTAIDWVDVAGQMRVTFDGNLTVAQQVAVQQRMLSATPAEEQIRTRAVAYLIKTAPTAAETHAQVRRLTRILLGAESAVLPGSSPGQDRA